ncbi:hypothetical protein PAXRUDRAFT_13899 [Paxillus rubicundulus Ve08.2h10]|uniref:Uncharacterized protein n=1 Tax=Paxillus rubicundulus Ve08.2h10 TaxID=930991 RepID=A0A0D0DXQ1_9AGAM|nr:hypothetical protein PAXRUDRAFT_13899 [Paxillus rubicundulus Ve08.2h10]
MNFGTFNFTSLSHENVPQAGNIDMDPFGHDATDPFAHGLSSQDTDHFGHPLFSQPNQSGYPQGAYMQEIVLLKERCKTLEMQLLQVTTERDTMKLMFNQLSTSFKDVAPKTWGRATASNKELLYTIIYKAFPILHLSQNDWKLESLCTQDYPGWAQNNLEDMAGCSAHWGAKQEDRQGDNTNTDNELGPGTSKKRKAKWCKSKVMGKKIKVLSSEADFNMPSPPPTSSCSLSTQSSLPDSSPSSSGSVSPADNSSSPGPSGPSSSPISPESDVQPKPIHRTAVITPPPPGSIMEAQPPAAVPTPTAVAPSSILPATVVVSDDKVLLPAALSASKEKNNKDKARSTVPTTSTSTSTAKRRNVISSRKMRPTKNKTG